MTQATVTVSVEAATKKEYPPRIKAGKFRAELLDGNGSVLGTSETVDLVVDVPGVPTEGARVRISRLDESGNVLEGSEYTTEPFDINQLIAVPSAATVTVSLA